MTAWGQFALHTGHIGPDQAPLAVAHLHGPPQVNVILALILQIEQETQFAIDHFGLF